SLTNHLKALILFFDMLSFYSYKENDIHPCQIKSNNLVSFHCPMNILIGQHSDTLLIKLNEVK
ncbi:hypothetical protein, partial [Pectobacterium carotovorum]|uniref:hypothetical protein n=1 Tax=Pectobacterium carotovorum TaxID=554 RepID=UPI001F101BE6